MKDKYLLCFLVITIIGMMGYVFFANRGDDVKREPVEIKLIQPVTISTSTETKVEEKKETIEKPVIKLTEVIEEKKIEIPLISTSTSATGTATTTQTAASSTVTKSSSNGGSIDKGVFTITNVDPNVVDVGSGDTITIIGTGLNKAKTFKANNIKIDFKYIDDDHISIIAGETLPEDVYTITVTNSSGQSVTLENVLEVKELNQAINEGDQ